MKYNAELKVLVVDDMMTMRKILSQQLRTMGFNHVHEAVDGIAAWDALEKAAAEKKPFDIVVSDWNMPNMKGIDLLKKCRNNVIYKTVAFLIVTAEAEISQVKEAVVAGVDNYVVKPFTPASFTEKFNQAC